MMAYSLVGYDPVVAQILLEWYRDSIVVIHAQCRARSTQGRVQEHVGHRRKDTESDCLQRGHSRELGRSLGSHRPGRLFPLSRTSRQRHSDTGVRCGHFSGSRHRDSSKNEALKLQDKQHIEIEASTLVYSSHPEASDRVCRRVIPKHVGRETWMRSTLFRIRLQEE